MAEYSEETKELIDELVADGNDYDVLEDFIKEYSESQFIDYIEEYADMVDDIGIGVVSAFLENFDIADISSCRDAYMGCYESGAEFAQNLAEDCGDVPRGMSSWIEIDWKASWDNLDYDYVESDNGHIFSQNF